MITVRCSKCNYVWDYKGDRAVVSCPNFRNHNVVIADSIYRKPKKK